MSHESIIIILGALFSVSEALAIIPAVKSNSIFQLVYSLIVKAKSLFSKPGSES